MFLVENTHLREKRHNFAPGDNVEVTDGELVNLRGKIQSIDGDKVVIMPDHEDLNVSYWKKNLQFVIIF